MIGKSIFATALALGCAFSSAAQADSVAHSPTSADTLSLSLDQCIAIALNDNPTIRVADMEIRRMDYSKKETIGQLLPTISFGASYNRTLAKQTMYMNMRNFGGSSSSPDGDESDERPAQSSGSSNGIKVGLDNSYSAGFSLAMPALENARS